MRKTTDFLVIGSGIAGMLYALKVADYGKVLLVTKKELGESNSKYAQGGIAAVMYEPDSFEKHIKDTLIAGDGLCDENVVRMVVTEAPERIQELIELGINFDKTDNGRFELGREGGHSYNRILHHKDITGEEIIKKLKAKVRNHSNIEIWENAFAIDLITQHHLGYTVHRYMKGIECYGAYILDTTTETVHTVLAKKTIVATGGIGNIYSITTNPTIATGDGIAMAYRAKAIIENMEFIQFHPTALYDPKHRPSFLISEAVRGFGAILRNQDGEAFMHKYDHRKELAPRDIVARAIDTELKQRGEDYVLLDTTHLNADDVIKHFPNIYKHCLSIGIDITKEPIPVVPAAHYLCGGIKTDINGRTTIKNLYAIGEVANTGLHGANRLASNSLLEATVFAHRAAMDSIKDFSNIKFNDTIPDWDDTGTTYPEEMVLITQEFKELQQIMTNYVGIVRSNLRLERALKRLEILYKETEALYEKSKVSPQICELRNGINVAYLIIKMAKQRRESRGLHYNINYPLKLKNPFIN